MSFFKRQKTKEFSCRYRIAASRRISKVVDWNVYYRQASLSEHWSDIVRLVQESGCIILEYDFGYDDTEVNIKLRGTEINQEKFVSEFARVSNGLYSIYRI